MTSVGIIANPAAGKDIRRLVAFGTQMDNHEKMDIVRRVLLGLDAMGVDRVWLMPDTFDTGLRALEGLKGRLKLRASLLQMRAEGTAEDSSLAAHLMTGEGVACIITLGGDGTNRAVAKGCGRVPLIPISTGTNNVFPRALEGTTAGLAAGVAAMDGACLQEYSIPTRKLLVKRDGEAIDMALIDVVVTDDLFIGTKAIWEASHIKEVFTSQGRPSSVGFSSIIGCFKPLRPERPEGMHLVLGGEGQEGQRVLAPIAPGLIRSVSIRRFSPLRIGEATEISHYPSTLALDGEREIYAAPGQHFSVELSPDGPFILDHERILEYAAQKGLFHLKDESCRKNPVGC
jgi:predicted polyphosphate/ATP-dependent NAD kinase